MLHWCPLFTRTLLVGEALESDNYSQQESQCATSSNIQSDQVGQDETNRPMILQHPQNVSSKGIFTLL